MRETAVEVPQTLTCEEIVEVPVVQEVELVKEVPKTTSSIRASICTTNN